MKSKKKKNEKERNFYRSTGNGPARIPQEKRNPTPIVIITEAGVRSESEAWIRVSLACVSRIERAVWSFISPPVHLDKWSWRAEIVHSRGRVR